MSNGIYSALSGAIARQHQLDLVGHNLANVDTAGYREQRLAFADVLVSELGGNRQVTAETTVTDGASGALLQTGNPLDLAIAGEGYFTVGSRRQPLLTRDGSFQLDADGQLVSQSGMPVLDPSGSPIVVDSTADSILVAPDGSLWTEFGPIGQVGVIGVEDPTALVAAGGGLYRTPAGNQRQLANPEVVQGFREQSNVNAVRNMTEMITLHRYFEAMHQLIQEHRQLDNRVIRAVGNPAG